MLGSVERSGPLCHPPALRLPGLQSPGGRASGLWSTLPRGEPQSQSGHAIAVRVKGQEVERDEGQSDDTSLCSYS